MRDLPRVQMLCEKHWPGFCEEWRREKEPLVMLMGDRLDTIRVDGMVRAAGEALGREAPPFVLAVHFVRGLGPYRRVVDAWRLILGDGYLAEERLVPLELVLEAQLSKLVLARCHAS